MADKEVRVKIIGDTSDLTKKLSNLKKDLKDIANGVNGNNNAFDKLSKDADNLKDSIKDTDKAVDNLNDSLNKTNKNNNFDNLNKSTSKLSTNITKLKDKIKDAFSDLNGKLGNGFDVSNITKKFTAIKDSMKELGGNILTKVSNKFKEIFSNGKEGTTLFSRLKNILSGISGKFGDFGGKIKNTFSNMRSSMGGIVSTLANISTAINTTNADKLNGLKETLKSLKKYQKEWRDEIKNTEKAMKEVNKTPFDKDDPKKSYREKIASLYKYNEELDKSKQKYQAVTEKIKETKNAMKDMLTGIDMSKIFKSFDSVKEPLSKLKEAFSQLKSGNFAGAFDSLKTACGSTVGKLTAVVAGITAVCVALYKLADAGKQRFFSGLEDMKNTFQPLVNLVKSLGQELKTAFENITGTQLDLSGAIEQAVEFESTMAQVGAIAGASGNDLVKLSNTAREWGATTRYSANQVAEAMTYMGMSGWSATEITQGLEGVLNLATVGCIDLGQASDFVTDGLTALGMSASQSNDFVDMLSATIVNSNTGVAQMQGAFENVAPIAGTLGISMSDLSVALGLMANQGVKAEKAGTALKNLLTNMSSPTEAMTKAIQKYNLEGAQKLITDGKLVEGIKEMKTQLEGLSASQKASVITTIAGREALSGVSALLNSTTNDINNLKFAVDSSTKSSRAYAISLGLIDEKTGEVKVDINNLTKEQQKAYDQWQNFNSIMEETTDTMTLVGGSTTDLGAIIARFGEDASSDKVNNVLDFFDKMENAQGKAIEKMKQYGIELKRNDDGSIDFGETLKNVAVKWDDLGESQKKALAEQLGFKGNIEDLNDLFGNQGEKIEELVDEYEKMEGVSEHLAKSFDATLKGSILSLSSAIQERLLQVFDKIKPVVQGVVDTLKTFFDIWNGMSDKFSNLKGFGDAIAYLEEQSRSWGESIKNGLSSAISSIDEFINSTSFDNVLQIGTNIIQGICDGIINAYNSGALTSAISGFIEKICNWITTNGAKIQEAGRDIINAIKEGIANNRDNISSALETVFGIVNTFINGKKEIFRELGISCGAKLIEGLLLGVIQDAGNAIGSGLAFVVTSAGQLVGDFLNAGLELGKSLLDGIAEAIGVSEEWNSIKQSVQEKINWLYEHDSGNTTSKAQDAGLIDGNGYNQGVEEGAKKNGNPIYRLNEQNFKETFNQNQQNGLYGGQAYMGAVGEGMDSTKSTIIAKGSEVGTGTATAIEQSLNSMDTTQLTALKEAIDQVGQQTTTTATTMSTAFNTIRDSARTSFMGFTNIVRNQMLSCSSIVKNQVLNMRTAFTQQFMSMSKVASTQLNSVRTAVVSKMMSIARVVGTQAKSARDNLTRQFMSMNSVVATQMAKCLSTVQSYMAQIKSATNQQMTMKFKVEKTITTTNVTKNVQEGMRSTMASMNSNMMGVGSPNIMSAGGLGTININANSGGISGNLALEVPLYLDGKEIARASAVYTEAELAKLKKRNDRKRGK